MTNRYACSNTIDMFLLTWFVSQPAILCVVASLLLLLRATYGLGQTAQNWNPLTGKYWGPRQASYASYVLGIILGAWPLLAAIVCLFAAGKRLLGVAHGHSGAA